jgi:hypothetical protein
MPRWLICYTDGDEDIIECDSIQPAGDSIIVFGKSLHVQTMGANKNQNTATPVAFVSLANPGVRLIRLAHDDEGVLV